MLLVLLAATVAAVLLHCAGGSPSARAGAAAHGHWELQEEMLYGHAIPAYRCAYTNSID